MARFEVYEVARSWSWLLFDDSGKVLATSNGPLDTAAEAEADCRAIAAIAPETTVEVRTDDMPGT